MDCWERGWRGENEFEKLELAPFAFPFCLPLLCLFLAAQTVLSAKRDTKQAAPGFSHPFCHAERCTFFEFFHSKRLLSYSLVHRQAMKSLYYQFPVRSSKLGQAERSARKLLPGAALRERNGQWQSFFLCGTVGRGVELDS